MEGGTPSPLRLSIRIIKSNTEPTLYDERILSPKQKRKNVSFGSVDIFEFLIEQSPILRRLCGLHSPIPKQNKPVKMRRFSI